MPNKVLGQHFLENKKDKKKLVDALNLTKGDKVLEIGPGKGEITKEILKKQKVYLKVIEKDESLVDFLKNNLKPKTEKGELEVIRGDILENLSSVVWKNKDYKMVGNLPFYITGKLLRDIFKLENKPKTAVFVLQKEVAERVASKPPNMNILAASVQFWAEVETIKKVPKNHFSPPPEVDGKIIKLKPFDGKLKGKDYYKTLNTIFKHPRKTILNNIHLNKEIEMEKDEVAETLKEININPQTRPERLSVEKIKELSRVLYNV